MYKTAVSENVIKIDNPDIWRPILAISDAVAAYEQALKAPPGVSGVFNVSSGNFTVGEIGERVAKQLSERYAITPQLEIGTQQSYRNYRVSTKKAEKILGVSFAGTIESIIDELYKNVGTKIDFTDDRYYNIRIFKKILDNKSFNIPV
jgi:nucleoside-diphosphate-sugar epimerase